MFTALILAFFRTWGLLAVFVGTPLLFASIGDKKRSTRGMFVFWIAGVAVSSLSIHGIQWLVEANLLDPANWEAFKGEVQWVGRFYLNLNGFPLVLSVFMAAILFFGTYLGMKREDVNCDDDKGSNNQDQKKESSVK